jgi:hypothetical protein
MGKRLRGTVGVGRAQGYPSSDSHSASLLQSFWLWGSLFKGSEEKNSEREVKGWGELDELLLLKGDESTEAQSA